jgi:sorbitol-specific phosphotransferase system component IIBC
LEIRKSLYSEAKEAVEAAKVTGKEIKEAIEADTSKTADKETKAKETTEAKVATKSFFKEVGDIFVAIGHAVACFFKRLFTKKD